MMQGNKFKMLMNNAIDTVQYVIVTLHNVILQLFKVNFTNSNTILLMQDQNWNWKWRHIQS